MADSAEAPVAAVPDGSEGDHDWLFEYLMSAFKSPSWEIPLMMFIDDNWCGDVGVSVAFGTVRLVSRALAAVPAFQPHF